MVNFWQFCNANYQMLSEVRESVLERAATKAALEKEVAELRERTEEIRKNNAEDAMKVQDVPTPSHPKKLPYTTPEGCPYITTLIWQKVCCNYVIISIFWAIQVLL